MPRKFKRERNRYARALLCLPAAAAGRVGEDKGKSGKRRNRLLRQNFRGHYLGSYLEI